MLILQVQNFELNFELKAYLNSLRLIDDFLSGLESFILKKGHTRSNILFA